MGLSTYVPVASGPILPDSSWWMQRDLTRKYHAQVFQQELDFRVRLSHLYAASSRQELLHQEFGKNPNQIFQRENGKNLQQNSSKSPDSVLLKQPGWSSFCEVDSKTVVHEKCKFVDKEGLISKELKVGSDNGREEKSEQQKTETKQQQQERDISGDLEEQEKPMKNDNIPFNECQRLPNSIQLTTHECFTCNKIFKSQKDFESHLAGRKHAKKMSQRSVHFKDLSEVKDSDKKCENGGDSRLQKYGENLQQNSLKSPNSVLPKQPVWSSFCEVDSNTEALEKCNFIDKEVLMSKEQKEGLDNGSEEKSEQQKTQTEQQQLERDIDDNLEKQEKSMKNDSVPFSECQRSLNSNQLRTDVCITCNKVFKSQKDFESHLAGRKHIKQLSQRLICFEDLSEFKDGSKKSENVGDCRLQEYGKKLWQNSSKFSDSVLPMQQGWSSFCEVDSKTEVLDQCNFIDKEVLMSKELKEGSDNGSEEKSEHQTTQIEQQQQERDVIDDLEKQEKLMKNDKIPFSKCQRSSNSNQLTDECLTCNKVFKSQKDFELPLAGRKHAKLLSQRLINFEDLSEFKDGSKNCENAGDSRFLIKDNVEKSLEKELIEKVKYDGDLVAKDAKVGLEENRELNEQHQMMVGAMPSKQCKKSLNLSELSITNCKLSYIKGDEQKSSESKPVWKAKDDKDLGAKINEIYIKENSELIDRLQMKEGNLQQQKVHIEQQMTEGNSKEQIPQMEQQMVEGGTLSSDSNQLQSKQCIACNKLFNSQAGFESHLGGRKHAKQLLKRIALVIIQSDVKDDSKKYENASEKILSIDSGLVVKDNMEKKLDKELVEKVKYNEDLASNEEKIGMQENAELNEQQQIMVGAMPLKLCNRSSNSNKTNIKNCSYVKGDEQRSFENKSFWKAKYDKDLGATINQVSTEEIAELIDQHQMEGNSKQQKVQFEQQMPEGNSKKQNSQMEQQMMEVGTPSLKSNQSITEECVACNTVINSQDGFESHLAVRKYAKKSLQKITHAKALSEVRDDSNHCENAGEKILISIDFGLVVKDNVEKRMVERLVEKVKYTGDLVAKEDKVGMNGNVELNEQQQIMVGAMPFKPCIWSSNLSELSNKKCKVSYVECDEQKTSENKHVWKAKVDKDLGAKINEFDMEGKLELIDQHQMKEGNSKQQKVQIEQQMADGDSEKMMEKGTPSLKPNNLRTEGFLPCNKVSKSQNDFESHLSGRKHAKQLPQRITCDKVQSEVKDDSKKCENAGEKLSICIDSGLMVKDNVENRLEKELDEKVKYDGDLVAKEDRVGMKGNVVLNEQQQMIVGAMPSKVCKKSSNLSDLSIKNYNISYFKGDEQKAAENRPVWKPKDDKYLGAKINKIDMKKNVELIDQDQTKEGNSKQQKMQIEQQMIEGNSKQKNPQMEQQIMQRGISSFKSNQLRTEECISCNKVFNSQDDFESCLAGRKHAKQLQTIKCVKALSEVKDDSMKCENAGEKILISSDSGLLVKDNIEKRLEKELVGKVFNDGVLFAKEEKVGVKENAELNERQQIMIGSLPSKLCKSSSNLNELNIKNCKISYVKCDEQKSYENKPVWKGKHDKDLGAKMNEVDMKENAELIDQHQMKAGNSKQQNVQIEQQMTEGNLRWKYLHMEQQMMEGGTSSLKSNQLRTEDCVTCNKVFNSQDDIETHLAGRKHAKEFSQTLKCVEALSEVKDNSKKCENAGEKILINTDSRLLFMENIEKRFEKELVEKVKYDGVLVAKEEKVGVKENGELNEQPQIIVGSLLSKLCIRSSNLNKSSINDCKISYIKCDEQRSHRNKPVWKAKHDKDLGAKINEVDMKENTEFIDQHQMKEGNSKEQKVQMEQQLIEGNSKQQKPQMEQQMMEEGTAFEESGTSSNSNPLRFKECVTSNIALKIQGVFEAHLSGRKRAKQLKEMKTKVVWKVADDSDFNTDSNKDGTKEMDEHELEQMNTRGVSSKMCKMPSNARQLNIEECNISKENDDVNRGDKNKLVWKVKDDRNLDTKRNRVDMKESTELNEQCLIKEGDSEQQNFQSEQKMKEGKSKQQKVQMEQQMKGVSKTQKLQMKQEIMENGLKNKQHEGFSEQLKVNEYVICNTVLNFHGDSEAELAKRKHAKQLKKMENKTVCKVTDKRHLCSKSDKFLLNETVEPSEKQHMKGIKETAELSDKQHVEGMKETAELSETQHMKEDCMPSNVCKNSSNASQLSINEFKIPITKDNVDKGAINQSVWRVNEQQWMRKTNTKQQKLRKHN